MGAGIALFPPASLGFLSALSQVGLVIFIFLTGVRVDFEEIRHQSGNAVVTSNVSGRGRLSRWRVNGVAPRFQSGLLMNTRGLVEFCRRNRQLKSSSFLA